MIRANLPTAATHAGDLILPPCATYRSIQKERNDSFGARVHILHPKAEGTKPLSSVIMPNNPSFRLSIYLISSFI